MSGGPLVPHDEETGTDHDTRLRTERTPHLPQRRNGLVQAGNVRLRRKALLLEFFRFFRPQRLAVGGAPQSCDSIPLHSFLF